MVSEKDILNQIRKKHLAPTIAMSLVVVFFMTIFIAGLVSSKNTHVLEIVIALSLILLVFGSGAFVELYFVLFPQKDIFFHKYGQPSEAAKMVNEAINQAAIFEDAKMIITESCIYAPGVYISLRRLEDVLMVYDAHIQKGKKDYLAVVLVDKWGTHQDYYYDLEDRAEVDEAINNILQTCPRAKYGMSPANQFYVQENIVELPKK
jgi:hypothetical protein